MREAAPYSREETWRCLALSEEWARAREWCGVDPYDALSGASVPEFVRASPRLRQAAIQIGKRLPLDLRSLLGVPVRKFCKADGVFLAAYARLANLTGSDVHRASATSLADRLIASSLGDGDGPRFWGYEFDVQTRWAFYPAYTPNVIVTTFIAHGLIDAGERLGEQRWFDIARAAARWVDAVLSSGGATPHFCYVEGVDVLIHNANLLACGLLARVGALTGDAGLVDRAREHADVSVRAQCANGQWPYGERPGLGWVDAFHTAYVLDGLHWLWSVTDEPEVGTALERGLSAYVDAFFDERCRPKYAPESTYPLDIHAATTAIDVLARLRGLHPGALDRARGVAAWTCREMIGPDGGAFFQRNRFFTNRIPYIRWGQAHLVKALSVLEEAER